MDNENFVFPACENVERKEDLKTWFWTECLESAKRAGCKVGTTEFWVVYKIRVYETHGKYGFCVASIETLAEDVGISVQQATKALQNLCNKGKLFHIWCDRKVYRNKSKLYVTKEWCEERGVDPTNLLVLDKGKRNEKMLGSGSQTTSQKVETTSKKVETTSRKLETTSKKVESPLMNKYKRISKKEYVKEQKDERAYADILDENQVTGELREAFLEFVKSRKLNGKKMTSRALELAIKKVRRLESTEARQVEVVEQSILGGWSGLFPLKDTGEQTDTSSSLYQPQDSEDITYQRMFEFWKKYVRVSVPQTYEQVQACRELLADVGEDGLQRLIVALAMRSRHSYLPAELTKIKDFIGLKANAVVVQNFYDQHWQYWQQVQKAAQTGKEIWEV